MAQDLHILIITNYAPPLSAGSPIMLGRLLAGLPTGSFSLLTAPIADYAKAIQTGQWLDCPYHFIDQPRAYRRQELETGNLPLPTRPSKKPGRFSSYLDQLRAFLTIFTIRERAKRIHRERPIQAMLVTSDIGIFLIGGYLAAKLLKRPLYVFVFDLYVGNAFAPHVQAIAKVMEPKIFGYATKIFVTNRHTQEYLQKKYSYPPEKFVICPNPGPKHDHLPTYHPPRQDHQSIIYTGNIYWAQLENLQDLVIASQSLPTLEVQLYSPLKSHEWEEMKLTGLRVTTGTLSQDEAIRAQSKADLLFLPMAFNSMSPAIVATASPGKLAEYLASGKPILIYAPPYAQIARFAREEGFGLVVDEKDPEKLAEALKRLMVDLDLQRSLVEAAQKLLKRDYNLKAIQDRFRTTLVGDL